MTSQTTPETRKPDSKRIVLQRLVRLFRAIKRAWIFDRASSAEDAAIEAYAKGWWRLGWEHQQRAQELYDRWHKMRREDGITSA